jgi:hypothetical protein
MPDFPLILGNFVFSQFEIPESFKSLGGKQAHVKKEFPGGAITIRNLGYFPEGPLEWSGYLYGTNAFQRAAQLQRIVVAANSILLSYGPWQWRGELVRFTAKPRQQNLVPYDVMFEPTADLSGIGSVSQPAQSPESQISTQNMNLTNIQNGSASTLATT